MMLGPACPLELARSRLSRILYISSADAHRKTTRAVYSRSCFVCASMMRTPVTRFFLLSYTRRFTILNGRSVRRPVARAAGSVALTLLKYDRVMHPRWHGPQ